MIKIAAKRVFYVSMNGLTVYVRQTGKFEKVQFFPLNAEGVSRFSDYLSSFPALRSALLLDFIEEEFRVERVPRLRGADRRNLLDRKLNQYFRSAKLKLANNLEYISGKRQEERILLAAITNEELLVPWLQVLQQQRTPVMGLYSVAFLLAEFISKIRTSGGNQVVVSYQEGVGLRQSLLVDGKLLISRLAPAIISDGAAYRDALYRELDRTEKYINKLHLMEADVGLDVVALVPDGFSLPAEETGASSSMQTRVEFIPVSAALACLHSNKPRVTSQGNAWICDLLNKYTALPNYANADQLYYRRQVDLRNGLYAGIVLVALMCVGFLLKGGVDILVSTRAINAMNERISGLEAEYRRILSMTPHTDVPADLIRDSVLRVESLINSRISPTQLLRGISAEVRRYGSIEVEHIAWIDAPALLDKQTAGTNLQEFFVDAYPMLDVGANDKVIILRGRVTTLSKGYKDIFAMLSALSENIGKVESIKDVRVVQLPIDRESSGQVQGQYLATDRNLNADFVLRAVYEG